MKHDTIAPSSNLRMFIEGTLGFGTALDNKNQPSLFRRKVNSFYYAIANSLHTASINVVDLTDWGRTHVNEQGVLLYDIETDILKRIEVLVDKQLAKRGYRLVETTKNRNNEKILNELNKNLERFIANYRAEIDQEAIIRTSVSVRELVKSIDYELVVRIFISSNYENGFISIIIPNVIREVSLNVTNDQQGVILHSIKRQIYSYNRHASLFYPLTQVDISDFILNHALSNKGASGPEIAELWSKYRKSVITNEKAINKEGADAEVFPLYEWVERTEQIASGTEQEVILVNMVEMARQLINQYINFNQQFA